MSERGIIFSAPMVRALLAGTKTQTRRIINPPPRRVGWHIDTSLQVQSSTGNPTTLPVEVPDGWAWKSLYCADEKDGGGGFASALAWHCPYGYPVPKMPAPRLWVRETFRAWDENHCDQHHADDECRDHCHQIYVAYRASPRFGFRPHPDRAAIQFLHESSPIEGDKRLTGPWTPAIHMPRTFSRIALEVVEVRAQQLHDISEDDARAEGVDPVVYERRTYPSKHAATVETRSYVDGFAEAWAQINGADSWAANPWVWAVTFKRIEEPRHG